MQIERILGLVATAIIGGVRRKFGYDEASERVWVEAKSGAEAVELLAAFGRASTELNIKAAEAEQAVFDQLAAQKVASTEARVIEIDGDTLSKGLSKTKDESPKMGEKKETKVSEMTPEMRPVGKPDSKGGMTVDVGQVEVGPEPVSKSPEKPPEKPPESP
jgi:hypothetical protein